MIKTVSTGYVPRQFQQELHNRLKRFNVICAHRRFGKTHFSVNEMLDRALRCTLVSPQYAYVAPTYSQAKRIVWDVLKNYVKDIPGLIINEAELRIDIPRPSNGDRVRFILLGAENHDSLRGMYLDGVILDEYAAMDPVVWSQVVRPALSDRLGWAIFISTPKGQNHFYRIYKQAEALPDWFTATYAADKTGILPLSELEAARQVMSESEYEQEYLCSFAAALVGAYYGKEIKKLEDEGRVTSVPYDKAIPVHTFWDLGMSDTTCIWFVQLAGRGEVRFIDYHEEAGMDIPHYAKLLREKGYNYEEHVLPHDAKVRELGTGKTRQEVLKALCPGVRIRVLDRTPINDGIQAARILLAKAWFDKAKCNLAWGKDEYRGLESLKQYEKVWDSKNNIFQNNPKHNWASHGADAFRTVAMGLREDAPTKTERRGYQRKSSSDYNVV